ncbi:Kelch 3 [Paramuricea clavata]|uniref:Kelch 3 n=1 Tax=Paramuricea clavata TaxID=317549 RepID=A0A7D9L8X0_PARCT|nr:Kelch 3 [Paramuricea clavata]CAB4029860.1 Kelch 3 [Paramuricea clavata]
MAGSTRWLEYFISLEGLIKILEFIVSILAFVLILNFDDWSLFSRYGFYIIVSGLCWCSLLIILILHAVGLCAGKVYGNWQREYSLFVFMLSYSLSFMFLFFFGSALLAQWAYDLADGFLILCVILGFVLVILFFIDSFIYYKRVRQIRIEEVTWKPKRTGTSYA